MSISAIPTQWTLDGFCEHFSFVHGKMLDHRFVWMLGAGASRDSGIPTAGELADRWLRELHARFDSTGMEFQAWLEGGHADVDGLDPGDPAASYPEIYRRRFRDFPEEGFAYLESVMSEVDPSPGYSILATALSKTRHNAVVTTNFDNLVSDALSIYTDTFPFVCGHESLAGFITAAMRRPLVCKIHRDLLLGPLNEPRGLKRLHDAWGNTLRQIFTSYTPLFIGYGGHDDTLMDLLESLDRSEIR